MTATTTVGRVFPALGFDPAPGDVDTARTLAVEWERTADDVQLARGRAVALHPEGLRAKVVDRFLDHLTGPVAATLASIGTAADVTADVARGWAGTLANLQDEADALERRAVAARDQVSAGSALLAGLPNAPGPGGPAAATGERDEVARRRDAAQDEVLRARSDLANARAEAHELHLRYLAAAARASDGLPLVPVPDLAFQLVPGVTDAALVDISNLQGEHGGGLNRGLPTDPVELQRLLDEARALGLPPKAYRALLQQHYLASAAERMGIDLDAWDPAAGATANQLTIQRIYEYYGGLYLDHPDRLHWAGMANLIGGSFGAGFFDLATVRELAGRVGEVVPDGMPLPPQLRGAEAVAGMSEHELAYYERTLLAMQKAIFFDAAAMHEAYLTGGRTAVEELRAAGVIDGKAATAWQDIDSGDPARVSRGNAALLSREQNHTITHQYDQMRNHPVTGEAFTYLMTVVGTPSIPGAESPGQYSPFDVTVEHPLNNPLVESSVTVTTPFPDFNVANEEDRWTMVQNSTLPAWEAFRSQHPDEVAALVAQSPAERMAGQRLTAGGADGRIDELLAQLTGGFSVDADARLGPWDLP